MQKRDIRAAWLLGILALLLPASAGARDQIRIVGSSTVYPFATVVAETFGKGGKFKTPIVESTGTGGGFKLFCAGVGVEDPDIADASRRIKPSELELCAKNGVTAITEVKIGYDGIVVAHSKKAAGMALTRRDLFDGRTNREGWLIYGSREIFPNTDLNLTTFLSQAMNDSLPTYQNSALNAKRLRLQADLLVKF